MKISYRFIVLAVIVAYMLFLCSCFQIKRVSEDAQSGTAGVDMVSGPIDQSGPDDVEAVTDDKSTLPHGLPESVLGSVSFTPDTAHTAKGDYLPGEDGLTLEVTDAQGIKWSLEIPAGAVPSEETVSMTALNGIKGDVLTKLKSGVLLAPDGLQFIRAARLTVSGPGIDDMMLLTADHGGNRLTYEPGARSEGKVTIGLLHFSSSFAGDNDDPAMDGKKSEMTKALKESMKKVKEYLGEPVNVPAPPDISFKCSENSCAEPDMSALDSYIKAFMEPEQQYAEELHRAATNYGLVVDTGGMYNEAIALLKELSARLAKKADKLIQQYSYQPEKCLAVSRAVIKGLTWCQNYGAELDYDSYFQTIATWLDKTADKYLKDLREQHDFKAVHAILRVGREAELLGGKGRDYISEVEKAMRMMVRFDTTITVGGAGLVYDLKGEAEVPYVFLASYQTGTGTGRYTGFKSPEEDVQLVLSGFDVTVFIEDFNPCKAEEIKVYINRFGPEMDTYTAKGYSAPAGTGLAWTSGRWAFSDKAAQDVSQAVGSSDMLFRFELPFTNGSQIMAEQEYNVPISEAKFRYHLVLEHKPQ